MAGLPYSGKSTWARALGYPVVSFDDLRKTITDLGYEYEFDMEIDRSKIAKIMVVSLFNAGHKTVIVDGTHLTDKQRSFWICGKWVTVFNHITTPAEECLKRATEAGDNEAILAIGKISREFEPWDGYEVQSISGGLDV